LVRIAEGLPVRVAENILTDMYIEEVFWHGFFLDGLPLRANRFQQLEFREES
jgi:hypothetical protein